jgi:hypothetical protein
MPISGNIAKALPNKVRQNAGQIIVTGYLMNLKPGAAPIGHDFPQAKSAGCRKRTRSHGPSYSRQASLIGWVAPPPWRTFVTHATIASRRQKKRILKGHANAGYLLAS